MGIVTGQGLLGLIRERYGVRWGATALAALVVANLGTTCAEFAGIAAALEMALPLLWFMRGVASDPRIMGEHALGTAGRRVTLAVLALVGACIALFIVLQLA